MISHDQVWRIAAWKSIHYFHFGENIKRSDISTYKSFSGCISWCSGVKKKKSRVMTTSHHRSQHHFISSLIYTSLICGIWHLASEEEGNIQKKLLQGQIQARTSGLKQHFVQFNIKFTSLSIKSSSTEPLKLIFFLLSNYPYQWPLFHLIFKYWSYCSHSCSITKTQPYTVISMYGYTSTILIPLPINDLDRRVMIMGC